MQESTVLLQHIKKQIEEFDERALMDKVRKLIKEELRRYDADRTGMPDYALESSGGSVLSTRCTVQYNERSRTQKIFGIPLWYDIILLYTITVILIHLTVTGTPVIAQGL